MSQKKKKFIKITRFAGVGLGLSFDLASVIIVDGISGTAVPNLDIHKSPIKFFYYLKGTYPLFDYVQSSF